MPPVCVLLVESDCSTQLAVQQQLEQDATPYQCAIASSLTEARAIARRERLDIAVLTVHPSCLQGDAELLADLMAQGIPVVVAVARGQEHLALDFLNQGASDYVIQDRDRPVLPLLPFTLNRVLETCRLQRQQQCWQADRLHYQSQEQMHLGQQRVLELLIRDRPLGEILAVLIQTLEAQSTMMMGSILLLDGPLLRYGAAPSLPTGLIDLITQHGVAIGPNQGSCGTAAYLKQPVVAADIATDPVWSEHRQIPLAYGLRACWSVPILSATDQVLGTFAMYYPQPQRPSLQEWERVMAMAHLAGVAIERKRTQETLYQYQRMVAQAADGLALVDRQYVYQFVNQTYLDRTGQAYDDIVGHSVPEVLGEEAFAIASKPHLDRCFAGETVRFEHWFHFANYGCRFVAVTYSPYLNSGGEIVGAVVGSRDITDVKQAETALAKEVMRNQTLFDASFDGIVVLNPQGDVVAANPSFARMLGYRPDEMDGLNVADWDEECSHHRVPATVQAQSSHLRRFEARHRRKDGSFYDAEISCNAVDWDGEPLYFAVCRDVTERKQAEATLQNLVEGAAAITGNDLFPALAHYMATALDLRYVIISQIRGDRHETSAFWANGQLQPNISCVLDNTPWAMAVAEGVYMCAQDLQDQFPDSELLQTLGADSYIGVALTNQQGQVIGSLCVLDHQPIRQTRRTLAILRVFAVRIGAEMERQGAIDALRQLNQELETRVEQRMAAWRQINQDLQQAIAERQRLSDRLTLAIRSGGFGIWELDIVRNELTWDDRMGELYGRPSTQGAKTWEEWLSFLHPDDRAKAIANPEVARYAGGDYEAEFRVVHPNGQIRFIKAYGIIQRDRQGVPQRAIGVNVDITQQKQVEAEQSRLLRVLEASLSDRRQAEMALRDSERRFRAIFNHTFQFTGLLNPTGTVLEVNQTALDFAGVQLPDVIHQPFWETPWWRVSPQVQEQLQQAIARAAQGEFVRYETEAQGVAGKITLDFSLRPLQNEAGEIILLIPEGRDITERKRAERQLQTLSDRLALAVTSGAIGIWDWDIVHNTLEWDERMFELYGIAPSEFQGMYESWSDRLYPNDRATVEQAIQQSLDGEKDFDIEFRVLLPGGTIRFIKACGLVQRDDRGLPLRMAGINFDISDRKQAEEQVQQANEQLREANAELARATRLKDEFLASMSHELRTPLNAILGMAEALQEEVFGPLAERQRKATVTIRRSGQHLLDLINDILDLAKIESGKMELNIAPTSVVLLCNSSLSFIRQTAYTKRIQISTDIPADMGEIAVDERRLRQVLINLLSNAVKFTPEGGQIALEVRLDPSRWVQFRVIDTGIGIAAEDMPRLFQSFVQIDSRLNRQHSGTGLGLALVKRIVDLQGGWVTVTSQPGEGSCFTVTLPYRVATVSPPLQSLSTPPHPLGMVESLAPDRMLLAANDVPPGLATDGAANGTMNRGMDDKADQPLILIVEDNLANLDTFSNYLIHWGYQVLAAKNGQEAIAIAQWHSPHLIVMDIQMPEMDGLEATRQIRSIPTLATVPIIALTALAMSGDRDRCLAAGVTDYLTKPVSLKHLASTIDQLLQ